MSPSELCASLSKTLHPLFECLPAPQEGVRVRTPLMYPDGGIVDVFVLERSDTCIVTDFGDALTWLRAQSLSRRRSPKQRLLIEDVCKTLDVELYRGQLVIRSVSSDALGEAVLRLAQAAVRVSDIWFTLRTRSVRTVADEVNEWLIEKQMRFDRGVRQRGRSGGDWTIDYRTYATARTSLIFLLNTGSRGAARRILEHVLAGCVDLSHLKANDPHLEFISLFNDTEDIWREEDFSLMEEHSVVARWSHPDELERMLTAV